MKTKLRTQGFTLIEILIVISMILFLFGLSLPVYQSMMFGSEVENANKILVSTLRRAQTQSTAGLDDSKWGVYVTSTHVILFKGDTYATRDTTADTSYTFPAALAVSGPTEIVFTKRYGTPSTTGTIILSLNDKIAQIVINSKIIESY